MWGFKNHKNRTLAKKLFNLIIKKSNSLMYNSTYQNQKDLDQLFLANFVYKNIKKQSVIHDSYFCNYYLDSKPFPTQRKGNCFVGGVGLCNETENFYTCPVECRPKKHLDWTTC